MYFLLSGEGPTDMGVGSGDDYKCGPMAVIVDQIVESKHDYSTQHQPGIG